MLNTPPTPVEPQAPETLEEPVGAAYEDHPGADTLSVPTWDESGFLRWGHRDPDDEEAA